MVLLQMTEFLMKNIMTEAHNNVDKGTILLVEEDEPETDVLSKTEESMTGNYSSSTM